MASLLAERPSKAQHCEWHWAWGTEKSVQPCPPGHSQWDRQDSEAQVDEQKQEDVDTVGAGGETQGQGVLMPHLPPSPALPTCGVGSAWNGECAGEKQRREYPFSLMSE